jgi:hypothetical protein
MVMKKQYDIDIKDILHALDTHNTKWYDSLTTDEKKKLNIWQIMRFMCSCQTNNKEIEYHYLTMTNDIVNVNFNLLKHHPELQYKLLQLVGVGKKQFHPWVPPSNNRGKSSKLVSWFCEKYANYSYDEVLDLLSINEKSDIILFLKDNGLSDDEINDLLK